MISIGDVEAAAKRIAASYPANPFAAGGPMRRAGHRGGLVAEAGVPAAHRLVQGARRDQQALDHAARGAGQRHRHRLGRKSRACDGARRASRRRAGNRLRAGERSRAEKVDKLRKWGAEVRTVGALWDESNRQAIEFARAHRRRLFPSLRRSGGGGRPGHDRARDPRCSCPTSRRCSWRSAAAG